MPKSFGEKLKDIRIRRDLSQDELAALLGTSKQVISRYETSQRTPKLDTVQEYANKLSVPLLYLADNSITTLEEVVPPSPSSISFSEGWVLEDEPSISFPIVGSIAAGYDHEPLYDYTGDTQSYPKSVLHGRPKEDFFVLRVSGRSMEPMFFDGDTVLVLRCEAVDQGTVSVVLYNGDEASLKKVRYAPNWLEMIPINPEFPVKRIEGADLEKCRIMGRAMSMSREL